MTTNHRISVTTRGRVTLPVEIRRRLDLKAGGQFIVAVVDGMVVLSPDEQTPTDIVGAMPSAPEAESGDFQRLAAYSGEG